MHVNVGESKTSFFCQRYYFPSSIYTYVSISIYLSFILLNVSFSEIPNVSRRLQIDPLAPHFET